jgi:hypothetical protein
VVDKHFRPAISTFSASSALIYRSFSLSLVPFRSFLPVGLRQRHARNGVQGPRLECGDYLVITMGRDLNSTACACVFIRRPEPLDTTPWPGMRKRIRRGGCLQVDVILGERNPTGPAISCEGVGNTLVLIQCCRACGLINPQTTDWSNCDVFPLYNLVAGSSLLSFSVPH